MSQNFCNFEVPTKKYKSLMPNDKGTNVFSEIGKFFKEKDATSAMNAIMDMMDALSLSEKRLFGIESRCNCKLTQLQLPGLLMLFPCFMIRNTSRNVVFQTELIGKVFSHVTHSMIPGFKALFLGITDGRSQMLFDFSLVGEEGKKKNYGLKQRQLGASPSMTIFLLS